MHKSATKCNETISKWCKNKHGASKIIDRFQIGYLSKWYYILIIVSFESCGVDTLHTIAHISRKFQIHYHLWNLTQVNPLPKKILWPYSHRQLQISFKPIHQDHFWHHLDPISLLHQTTFSSSHIFKLQLSYSSNMCCIPNYWFFSCYSGVDILHFTPHIHTPCYPIGLLNYLANVIHI
jgi:hypothetical protein